MGARKLGSSPWFWGLLAALILGTAFRLVWVDDLEYKQDEAWTFALTRAAVEEGEIPWLGMPSSQNLRIPGLSLWVFYPLGWLFGTDAPTGLARGVQCVNLAALVLLVAFAWRCVPRPEKEWWLWAAALLAVNPLAVLFQRKIWPPCTLAPLLLAFSACWWYRASRWGAFGWGVFGVLVGQIHPGGFFLTAATVFWTLLFDRRRVPWTAWAFGAFLGSVPMWPWFYYLAMTTDEVHHNAVEWHRLIEAKFWTHWLTEPFGIGLQYVFNSAYGDFLAGPRLDGRPTYAVAGLHGLAGLLGAWLLATAGLRTWRERPGWVDWWSGRRSPSTFQLNAVLWGYGLILTATRLRFYRHYLLLTFPFTALWAARLALPAGWDEVTLARGRRALLLLCAVNALLTLQYLVYVHEHGGVPSGDYGPSYAAQAREGRVTKPPLTFNSLGFP